MPGHSLSKASVKAPVQQLTRRTHVEINACASRKLDQPEGYLDARAYITVIYVLDGRILRRTCALLRLRLGCR